LTEVRDVPGKKIAVGELDGIKGEILPRLYGVGVLVIH
jgi:hypothetical protein